MHDTLNEDYFTHLPLQFERETSFSKILSRIHLCTMYIFSKYFLFPASLYISAILSPPTKIPVNSSCR